MSKSNFGLDNLSNRDIWLEKKLKSIPAGLRILDAGAGELPYKELCSHLDYVSQDFGGYDGQGDGTGLQTSEWDTSKIDIKCDIIDIPEPDASFDVVMCTEVLEHVPDPTRALNELSRLLKPGGRLILTAPFCSLTHFSPYHFSTGFNKYYYESHLSRLGFDIDEVDMNGDYYSYLAQEIHRLPSVAEKYSNQKMNYFARKAQRILIKTLERFSKTDSGSNEFLCFGYHVIATKRLS